jgi:hypothetical protein
MQERGGCAAFDHRGEDRAARIAEPSRSWPDARQWEARTPASSGSDCRRSGSILRRERTTVPLLRTGSLQYVAATRSKMQRRHFEVVLGRIEAPDCDGEVFAVVRDLGELARERIRWVLRRAGRGPITKLTVLSDEKCGKREWIRVSFERPSAAERQATRVRRLVLV